MIGIDQFTDPTGDLALAVLSTNPSVREALGPDSTDPLEVVDQPLTEDHWKLLGILVDPLNDLAGAEEDFEDTLDAVSCTSDVTDAHSIAGRLQAHLTRATQSWDDLSLDLQYNDSEGYHSFSVSTRIEPTFWLSTFTEIKHLLPRRSTTGLRVALHMATAMVQEYGQLLEKKQRLMAPTLTTGSTTTRTLDPIKETGSYRVAWQIDSEEGVSPARAAADAWTRIFRRGRHQPSTEEACVFDVSRVDDHGVEHVVQIDLSEKQYASLFEATPEQRVLTAPEPAPADERFTPVGMTTRDGRFEVLQSVWDANGSFTVTILDHVECPGDAVSPEGIDQGARQRAHRKVRDLARRVDAMGKIRWVRINDVRQQGSGPEARTVYTVTASRLELEYR